MLVSLFQNKNKNWLKFALSLQMALGSLPLVTSSQAISDDDLTKPQYAENGLGEDVMALTRQSYRIIEKDQTSRMRSWADAAIKALGGENSAAAKVLSPFSSRAGGESGRYNLSEGDIMTPYRGVPTNISKLRVTSGPSSSGDTHSIFIELEEGRRVHQHEIAGFTEFTTTPKLNPQDNVVFFATKERGVFAIPLRIYQQGLFKGPIPVIHVFGNPPFPGAEITNIHSEKVYRPSDLELAEENKAFEVLTDRSPLLRDGSNVSDDLLIKASDVTITYKWTDKSGETHVLDHVYNLQDVMKVMVDKLLAVYAGGIVASGDIERYQEIKALMDTRAELTNAAISEMNRIIGDPSEHKVEANVDMLALKNVISHPSMKDGWSKVVPGKNGTSTLDQIYGMDRDQFEVREVRKSYQEVILASEEQEARARSDAQQSLEEYNSRKSVVRDGLNIVKYTIAKVRGYSSAYWFRFAQIYMKHMHHSTYSGLAKAATTVSAGASTYAAVLTASQTGFGPEFVLDFHQQILEGMRIVVDSSQMVFTNSIELIKATFGYESAMNAAYAAAGSISAQAIYFGFYGFLPYILKNAANRGASHAKISYEAMKRWFAKLNYGLAAHYHESIMNQQLLYRVLDAGYKPSDFPGIVTHSRNASKATIRAQADEINAEMKLDELAKYRAAQLAALVMVARAKNIDITTLESIRLLLHNNKFFKENGLNDASATVREFLGSEDYIRAWESMKNDLHRSFVQLNRTFGKMDGTTFEAMEAETIAKYVRSYEVAANEITAVAKDSSLQKLTGFLKNRMSSFKEDVVPMFKYMNNWRQFSLNEEVGMINERSAQAAKRGIDKDILISFSFIMPLVDINSAINAGKLLAFLAGAEGVVESMEPKDLVGAPKFFVIAVEQTFLAGTVGVMQAEQGEALEEFKMEHAKLRFQPFLKDGLSKSDQKKFYSERREMLKNLYDRAGISYTEKDLDLRRRSTNPLKLWDVETEISRDSFSNGLKSLGHDINNNAGEYLTQHLKGLENISGQAAQGQLAGGALAFTFGNALSAMLAAYVGVSAASATASGGADVMSAATVGVFSAINMLILKHTLLGYAFTWTYAHAMYHAVTGRIEAMKNSITRFTGLIERGIELNRPDMYSFAAKELVKIYQAAGKDNLLRENGVSIEAILSSGSKGSAALEASQAALVLKTSLAHPPLATKEHRMLELLINVGVGGIASTALSVAPWGLYTLFADVFPNWFAQGVNPYLFFAAFTPLALTLRTLNIQLNKKLIKALEGKTLTGLMKSSLKTVKDNVLYRDLTTRGRARYMDRAILGQENILGTAPIRSCKGLFGG